MAEAGTMDVRSGAQDVGRRELDSALQRDTGTFLSTHLLRELVAVDARSEAAADSLAERAAALLGAVLAGLELSEGAIVRVEAADAAGLCVASRGIPDHARELLEARLPHLESLGGSLAQRALAERRVLLLDRATRDPLMPALRDGNPDIEYAAVVPLSDQGMPVGVLVLAARGGRLSPALLRSLAVAFRLLGLLLAPGRGQQAIAPRGDDPSQAADSERYLFEIEELTARLAEVRETARQMEERASAAEAALRAETESFRARSAELEAQLAGVVPAVDRERELEALCAEQRALLEEHEGRVDELEREVSVLLQRIEQLQAKVMPTNGAASWDETGFEDGAAALGDEDRFEAGATLDLTDNVEEQLGDIAAAAVAALDEAGEDDGPSDDGDALLAEDEDSETVPVEMVEVPEVEETEAAQAVLHIDSAPAAQRGARESAEAAGAVYWSGSGEVPSAATSIVAVNLLDEDLARAVAGDARLWSASRWIVYGADADSGMGFELGSCALLRRPIDPRCCLEQIQRKAGRKVNGLLMVSAQLREVAALRQALQEVDAAGSVACDTRQALDLLEIVRRPDAVLIDLALPQGQGLALAAQLRRQPETSDLPLLLLLPAIVDPARFRAEAEKAQLLGPFVAEDVHRLIRAKIAGRA